MKMIDLEFDPVKALMQVTIMRNVTSSKSPNHEYIAYFDNIEITLRKMRENNLKLMGRVQAAEKQIEKFSEMSGESIIEEYQEQVKVEDKLTDDAWLKITPTNLNF